MKIVVLGGSPKGESSVTMQYVRYMQKVYPQHELDIEHVVPRIKKIESDQQAFGEIIERVRSADGVLWAFPLYVFLVHGSYKRFIELIGERGAQDAFAGRYAASLSTSIHFFDHTAHNYVHAVCDDLGMRYVGAFSPAMYDLLGKPGRAQLTQFAGEFFRAVEAQAVTQRSYAPLAASAWEYVPGPAQQPVETGGKRVVVITDAEPQQANLLRMIERFQASFAQEATAINLHDVDIKGGCLGCLKCGYDNECAYEGKDGFVEFYNSQLKPADILVFAGAMRDRYLSATWKTFFDRSFFNGHAPSLAGKQLGFLISGPLSQVPNLRQILEAWVQLEHCTLAGVVSDEVGDLGSVDGALDELAGRLVRYAQAGYRQPQTFLGVAGTKLFRDAVYGPLRMVFQADHRAYKRLGVYDFPQKDWSTRMANAVVGPLLRIPRFREGFKSQIKRGMIQPFRKLFQE
jgi:multimeric flavodoxin WrbA